MTNSSNAPGTAKRPNGLPILGTAGVSLLAVLCCAGPALIASGVAAGALGAFGAWISNPWVIVIAVIVVVVAVAGLVRHRRGPTTRSVRRQDCCTPPQAPHHLADRAEGR